MQTGNAEIRAQQLVLAYLGFYKGAIDGIWSDATIRAMKAFECDDSFLPAVPTNGLPFPVNSKLPKGMYWEKKLVNHRKLTPEIIKELLASRAPAKSSNANTGTALTPAPVVSEDEHAKEDSSFNPELSNAQKQGDADAEVETKTKGSTTVEKSTAGSTEKKNASK